MLVASLQLAFALLKQLCNCIICYVDGSWTGLILAYVH